MPTVDEPGAYPVWNANAFPSREGYTPKYIILHGTAGGTSAAAIGGYFQSTQGSDNPVSAHYVIGQDGMIVQCNKESDGAWGNGVITDGHDPWWDGSVNPNDITISIEHCKPSIDNSDALTPAQISASFTLIRHICQRHNIPMQPADATGGITGHYSMDPINRKNCPGAYPWNALWDFLKEGTMGVPQGWTDHAQTGVLTAPNGIAVVRGFRDYILANEWDANNLPLQIEQARNPLELGNTALGAGTQQIFRWSVLEWTAEGGVFVAWGGQELLATQKALRDAQAQVATLQQNETSLLLQRIADDTNRFNQIGTLLNEAAQLTKVAQA